MNKDIIVNSTPNEVEIALVENNKLVELHSQKPDKSFVVGDIFLGHIKKVMPGLNATFIDLGLRKDAFLHYTDLGPQIKSLLKYTKQVLDGSHNIHLLDNFEMERDNPKNGKIGNVFDKNQPILLQVLKEPISTKGPRLTCEITLPGRFMVITPFSDVIAVSKKISSADERKRLKLLGESIKPKKFGLILRTAAEGKKVADLHEELQSLLNNWKELFDQLQKSNESRKLLSELDKTTSILRDIVNDSFNQIVVNDKTIFSNVKKFMVSTAPELKKKVSLYSGNKHIFDNYGITKQIKSAFGQTTTMRSGAYIVIEHTEAMHVIDVNSGPKMKRLDQETAALQVNVEAAEEIARQLRLRDIGGLIIIDFIDMRNFDNRNTLFRKMKDYMRNDRAQHTILQLSKFGLMQITRQRTKPQLSIDTSEKCPTCDGKGNVNPTILIIDAIENDLEHIMNSRPQTKLRLKVHPYIHAYLKEGFPSLRLKWLKKYLKFVRIAPDMDLPINIYKFFDNKNDEIRLHS